MKSTTNIYLNLQMPNYNVIAYAVQGDVMSREITAILHDGQTPFTPSVGALGTIRYKKPDGTSGFYDTLEDGETVAVTWEDNVATIRLAEQVLTVAGNVIMQLSFYNADAERLSTFNFVLTVEQNPYTDEEFESTDYYSVLTARIAAVLGAVAHAPQINELNHWVLWDEEEQDYYDSGIDATGPQGDTGPRGYAVGSVARTSGTGAPGTTDTYTMYQDDPSQTPVGTFNVYNGSDGQGSPGSATPLMDGTASAGSANAYSREDHVHPRDTSRKPAKRNFVLLGDSFSIGYTTTDGTNYFQTDGGWANFAQTKLTELGHTVYTSNDISVHIPGLTGFASTLPFLTLLQNLSSVITDKLSITDIVVLGGTNDIDYASGIEDAIEEFVDYCNTYYPNADISVGVLGSDIYTLCNTIAPKYKHILECGGAYIADTLNMMGNADYICVDNTHLTESGYSVYAPYVLEAVLTGHTDYMFDWNIALTPVSPNISTSNYTITLLATPTQTYVYFDATGLSALLKFSSVPSGGTIYNAARKMRIPRYYAKLAQSQYYAIDTTNNKTTWCGEIYPYLLDTTVGIVSSWPPISVSSVSYYSCQINRSPVPIFV